VLLLTQHTHTQSWARRASSWRSWRRPTWRLA
jgi:hypothetical protein